MTDSELLEKTNEAFNKNGFMVLSSYYSPGKIGETVTAYGMKFKIIGYATEKEVKKYCQSIGMPFTHKGAHHRKVVTD